MPTRGNPFRTLEEQLERMQRQMEEALTRWDGGFEPSAPELGTIGIDLADNDDEFVLTADVPGFDKDEIEVRLADDTIYIAAERERVDEETGEHYLTSERAQRTMRRSITLPEPVDEDGIEATCKNGVLTITLPKLEPKEAGGRRIDIE